jgi:predicted transposase YbfD/YdcC
LNKYSRLHTPILRALRDRLGDLGLDQVQDPRDKRGQRWSADVLLRTVLTALLSGCKSLGETESLTDEMSPAMRKFLRINRRVPDTTLRYLLTQLDPLQLRQCLHRQIHRAHRSKALGSVDFPFSVLAMDGKWTSIKSWDDAYAQKSTPEKGVPYGKARSITSCLVTSSSKVCIDVAPVPSKTNEMGQFKIAFEKLVSTYGNSKLFQMITYDAGGCSETNAQAVRDKGLHYLFSLKKFQKLIYDEASLVLRTLDVSYAVAETEDVLGSFTVKRRLYITDKMHGARGWEHLETVLRVESVKTRNDTGQVEHQQDRYFLSSLPLSRLTKPQWLKLVRMHWRVENNCHRTWDVDFKEDERQWITTSPQGHAVMTVLRRIAYNLMAIFRCRTQRSEDKRITPWRDVIRWFYNTMIATTASDIKKCLPKKRPIALQS